jgi:hypothetical protein
MELRKLRLYRLREPVIVFVSSVALAVAAGIGYVRDASEWFVIVGVSVVGGVAAAVTPIVIERLARRSDGLFHPFVYVVNFTLVSMFVVAGAALARDAPLVALPLMAVFSGLAFGLLFFRRDRARVAAPRSK